VESARLYRQLSANVTQELQEFEQLQSTGVDPATGERFASARALLKTALARNVPAAGEALIMYWDGRTRDQSGDTTFASDLEQLDLTEYEPFVRAIGDLLPRGGSRTLGTPVGEVLMAVRAVNDRRTQGAFVVVTSRSSQQAEVLDLMRTYAYVATGMLLLVTLGAWIVAGRLLAPVRRLHDTAADISGSDLTRRLQARGNDDLTALTQTFNAMLDRLEGAFGTQRQFLDDAGHELRTPVTILRGHLELMNEHDPAEVVATRSLLLEEIDRMSRLVDDLIVLAKAQRPDFVRPVVTQLGGLLDSVADKVVGLAPRRWTVDARAEGAVSLDPQRVTQALLQLATNAVQHTCGDDEIALGSRHRPGYVDLWVRDTGPGVAAEDAERIFARFQRGGATRTEDGSGLGLSIVTAIAAAHGGSVTLSSSPGRGATFTLTLPTGGPS
jgi:signal transduction histidine kinase